MSVRLKFVLVLTFVVSIILVSSFFIIYNLFRQTQKQEFDNRLWANAYSEALAHYNIKDTDKGTLDKLATYARRTPVNFSFALIDGTYRVIDVNPDTLKFKVDTPFLQKIKAEKELYFFEEQLTRNRILYQQRGCRSLCNRYGFR